MPVDLVKLKEKLEKKSSEQRGDRFSIKDGDNEIRILPPSLEYFTESVDYIAFEYLIHYNIGIEGNKTSVVCPKTSGKTVRCPICEAVYKLYKTGATEDKTLANSLRAKRRYIYNILDLKDLEKGIQVLETGPQVYERLLVFITNPKWGDLIDIDKGRNVTLTKVSEKESSSGYVEYEVTPDPEVLSVRAKLPKNHKEQIANLKNNIPTAKSYAEIKVLLEGVEEEPATTEAHKTEKRAHKEPEPIDENSDSMENEEPKKKDSVPTCFGVEYGPKRDQCMACKVKVQCREKYLEI